MWEFGISGISNQLVRNDNVKSNLIGRGSGDWNGERDREILD